MSIGTVKEMTFGQEDLENLSYALQLACIDCIGGDNGVLPDEYHLEMNKKLNDILDKIQDVLGYEKFDFRPKNVNEDEEEK